MEAGGQQLIGEEGSAKIQVTDIPEFLLLAYLSISLIGCHMYMHVVAAQVSCHLNYVQVTQK